MKRSTKIIFISLLVLLLNRGYSEVGEKYWYRKPFLRNYTPREYKGQSQIWSIAQDRRGIMYFANSSGGILEYDGVGFLKIPVLSSSMIRSVALGMDGKIYAGGISEFGFIKCENGKSSYVSLTNKIPAAKRHFGDVWQIIPTDFGVYFRTYAGLFRWHNNKIEIIGEGEIFYTSAYIKGRILALVKGKGLLQIIKNKISKINITDEVKLGRYNIYAILPFKNNVLFAIRDKGLFLYNWKDITRFESEADNFLRRNKIYTACSLPGNMFALGTKEGGAVIIDEHGKINRILNSDNALNDNTVRSFFVDNQDGFWVGMNNGVARLEIYSPYSVFTSNDGLKGLINAISIHDKKVYVATSLGLFRERDSLKGKKKFFEKVLGVDMEPRAFYSGGDELFVGTNTGIHVINTKLHTRYFIKFGTNVFWLKKSIKLSNTIFVGTSNGFTAIKLKGNIWQKTSLNVLPFIKIYSFEEDNNGEVWISSQPGVIYRLYFKNGDFYKPAVKEYNRQHGLVLSKININKVHGRVYIGTSKGLYRFDKTKNRIVKANIITGTDDNILIDRIVEKNQNEIFIIANNSGDIYLAKKKNNNKYVIKDCILLGSRNISIEDVIHDNNKNIWFNSFEELVHFNTAGKRTGYPTPKIIIRKVSVGKRVIYGQNTLQTHSDDVNIKYTNNSVTFNFGLTSYNSSEANRYQYKLEGLAIRWSDWTSENKIRFSGLREGSYTFYVRAKDVHGKLSNAVSFSFYVLPPWYRTNLAYIIYILLIFSALFLTVKLRSNILEAKAENLKTERDELDRIVKEKTRELRDAYDIIKKDLKLAWRIQNNFISKDYENYNDLEIEVFFSPMIEVGGDIYDIFKLSDGVYRVFLADATGHGIQAALTTMIIKAEYDKIKIVKLPPNELLRIFNNVFLRSYYHLTVFFTCVIVDIDLNAGEISLASAGHPDQYLITGGRLDKVQSGGSMIGLFENSQFGIKKYKIKGDEKILLFTDGLFEEFNENAEEYGEANLLKNIEQSLLLEVKDIVNKAVSDVKNWCCKSEINDDITFIGIKLLK
jgi:serine phosphatase RsbU (regulator of sigma subunit)